MSAQVHPQPDAGRVLAKALLNARQRLGLSQQELASILGVHRSGVSRLQKNGVIDADSKTAELALLLIRVYRALFALFGGDNDDMQHFLRTPNRHTGAIPAEQIQTVQGLVQVLQYLDAIRGRV